MQKKNLIAMGVFTLLVLPLISAYNGYSLQSQFMFFLTENIETIIYGTIFLGILLLVKTSLSKIFKGSIGGILSALISLLATYGIYTKRFDFEQILSDLGITGNFLPIILVLIGIILLGVIKSKTNFKIPDWLKNLKTLLFFGGIVLIALSRILETDLGERLFELGVVLLFLSILFWIFGKGKNLSKGGIKKLIKKIQEKEKKAAETNDPKEAAKAREEAAKAREELDKKQKQFEEPERKRIEQGESFNRVRKIGIQNLAKEREKEYNRLQNEIIPKIQKLSSKMGGGAFVKRRKDESDADYKERYKVAKENHKHLSQAHQIAKELRKKIKEIDERIIHLQKQLQR
jgi:hypothetical protein